MITDVLNACGGVTPGISSTILLVEAHDVLSIPAVDATGLFIATDIECKIGKKFSKIEAVIDTAGDMSEVSGDPGFKSFKSSIRFMVKDWKGDSNRTLMNALAGCGIIAIFQDPDSGKYYKIGSLARPAQAETVKGDSGLKSGDKNATEYSIYETSKSTIVEYRGDIAGLLIAAA